ncbi:MAG: hypothetical protein GY754_42325 [bacterium]|nr:hypothetical protein [bacterium]
MLKDISYKDFFLGFLSCLSLFLLLNFFSCGRTLSRFGLGDHTLNLPKNFQSIVSVSFHTGKDGKTTKDVTYITNTGEIRSIEYKDKPWQLEGSIRWKKPK